MKLRLVVVGVILFSSSGLVACDEDDETSSPTLSTPAATTVPAGNSSATRDQTRDRDQIQAVVRDYLAALQQADRDRARQFLHDGTRDADLDRARDQIRERQFTLVEITDIQVGGDRATATVRLRDKDGATVTRTLELQRDQDRWRIQDPALKE